MSREPAAAVALAVLIAGVFFAPEHIANAMHWWQPGIEHIAIGALISGLCLALAVVAWQRQASIIARVLLWPAYEGGMMAASRAALPMDKPVDLPPGQNMADLAFGPWATWLSIGIAFWGAAYVAGGLRDGRRTDRR